MTTTVTSTTTVSIENTVTVADACTTRLMLKAHETDYRTKADCDEIITFCVDHGITDLVLFCQDLSVSPVTWLMGTATKGHVSAINVDGHAPFDYMVEQAHIYGMKVYAWMYMYSFAIWGSTTGILHPDIPDNATYNDGGKWNFNNATARTALSDAIVDLFDSNPDIDGTLLTFETAGANTTTQDITDFMEELRPQLDAGLDVACTAVNIAGDASNHTDVAGMLANDLIDSVFVDIYYERYQDTINDINTFNLVGKLLVMFLATELTEARDSDLRFRWKTLIDAGYQHYGFFCWRDDIRDTAAYATDIDAFWTNTLTYTQNDVTSVNIVPGTSFSLVIGGATQTTAYADVADHTNRGPLKAHVEAAVGSENPAVTYYRLGSTTTQILVGDCQ